MILYLDKEQFSEGGEAYDDESEGPFISRSPTYVTTKFTTASFYSHKMFTEQVEISEKLADKITNLGHVYLGVVFYYDGDTFGTTYGLYEISGVSDTLSGIEKINKKTISDGLNNRWEGYKPWEGYFSGLIGAEIFKLDLVK